MAVGCKKMPSLASIRRLLAASLLASPALAIRSLASSMPILVGNTFTTKPQQPSSNDTPLPLVIWHGLGDSFNSEGMQQVAQLAQAIHPGTLVHPISLADNDGSADRSATFLGNVSAQVDAVCAALASHPILSTAPAIDALGFSQGGQFLRAYVQRCNAPPVRSLVTFGSQHNGITEFRACNPSDWLCRGAMLLLRSNTWSDFVQSRLVPAQYFRDPSDLPSYLEHSNFLADVNNERAVKNASYADNIARLSHFVMYLFDHDTTVVPKQTSWFDDVNGTSTTPLRERRLYKEDWLGLQRLDRKGGLVFRSVAGEHMQIPVDVLNQTMAEFFGPQKSSESSVEDALADPDEL
ncbi:hypothetical protein CDD81_8097 [Ophiocordyceps australis]|uniref:Palmitoyl-protein thioesterase 1 n=1 Tax=Ophiocordyceps australis TaxID=1399860 RepID=A0A2C5Y1V1_9HYPO|nr:hypothetical protein CDD81_8097 [Ophiocordyceps australis]